MSPARKADPSGRQVRRVGRGAARVVAALPMALALSAVTAVWVFGAVWSFTEQTAFATAKQFHDPALLPLVLDGLAISMAGVAFAASLDARPALGARAGTALAVLASATSNGLWAAERTTSGPAGPDPTTVTLGVGIPIAANIAFEVLLAELRRQVQRRRGLPAPLPLPTLRPIRLVLDPSATFRTWRAEVLTRTAPGTSTPPADTEPDAPAPNSTDATGSAATAAAAVHEAPVGAPRPLKGATPLEVGDGEAGHGDTGHGDTGHGDTDDAETAEDRDAASPAPAGETAEQGVEPAPSATPPHDQVEETEGGPFATPEPAQEPEPQPEPEPEPGSADARVVLLAARLTENPDMTGKDAETVLVDAGWGTSYRTARRLLADARKTTTTASDTAAERDGEPVADHEHARTGTDTSVVPVALSLVPRSPSPTTAEGEH